MRNGLYLASVVALLAFGGPQLDAQTQWTNTYVNQWVAVFDDAIRANPNNSLCVNLFQKAAAGLEAANLSQGVWWHDLPDPHNGVRYGQTSFDGSNTKVMIDARKQSPNGGVPGTVTHEGAHASRDPRYTLRGNVEATTNSDVGACHSLLHNVPVIPTRN